MMLKYALSSLPDHLIHFVFNFSCYYYCYFCQLTSLMDSLPRMLFGSNAIHFFFMPYNFFFEYNVKMVIMATATNKSQAIDKFQAPSN